MREPKKITVPAEYIEGFVWPEDENEDVPSVVLPSKYEVCDVCDGRGRIVNPSIDGHGITREEFDNDPEFFDDYRRGVYDINCPECGGLRVVCVLDEARCTDAQIAAYDRVQAEDRAYRRESAAESRYFGYDR